MILCNRYEERAVLEVLEKIKNLFRAYDIRGPVEKGGITEDLAYQIGLAVGTEARELHQTEIIVGRDGRISGPTLTEALIKGLRETGLSVIFIGQVPTPLVYFATHRLSTRSGVMVTASHNPGDDNGFKIVLDGKTLSSERIVAIRDRIVEQRYVRSDVIGNYQEQCIEQDYIDYICHQIRLKKPLKIVVDCGNGASGELAPKLYRALGCEVIELFCEIDGHFPNHHPDPTVPENLRDIIETVEKNRADLGLAFDGDADRLGVVTNQGEIIWPDRQLMLYVIDVLKNHPGSDIVYDVKCSQHLARVIQEHGGNPVLCRTGHSLIKAKIAEINSPLGGELSGHIFFRDRWFGFDDGLYVGARLLEILSNQSKTASEVFAELPNSVNTPELKLAMDEADKANFIRDLIEKSDFGSDARLITIDGLRVEFSYGWGLIRPSNTSPYLTLRFEANDAASLVRVQNIFRRELLKLNSHLTLPF